MWKQLQREGVAVARCTVGRLMRRLGLAGAVRGRAFRRTTIPDTLATRLPDLVMPQFTATRPNQLWVADLTYEATRRGSSTWPCRRVLAADRRLEGVVCAPQRYWHSMRWSRTAGRGRDRALGGQHRRLLRQRAGRNRHRVLFKTEEIYRRGPWRGLEDVEFATLEWVAWYNGHRLLNPLGYMPPAEFEQAYHDRQTAPAGWAVLT